jgi:hypothetical protein
MHDLKCGGEVSHGGGAEGVGGQSLLGRQGFAREVDDGGDGREGR